MSKAVVKANGTAKTEFEKDAEKAEIRELDAVVARMKANTPAQPYIMSTPSDRPYELSKSEVDNWRINTPFEADERHLQYMTFLWRDPTTTLFSLDVFPEEAPPQKVTPPPKSDAPVKKIKFDAYKNRKLQSQATTPAGQNGGEVQQGDRGASEKSKAVKLEYSGKAQSLTNLSMVAQDSRTTSPSSKRASEIFTTSAPVVEDKIVHLAKSEKTVSAQALGERRPVKIQQDKPGVEKGREEDAIVGISGKAAKPEPSGLPPVDVKKESHTPMWLAEKISRIDFAVKSRLLTPPTESSQDSAYGTDDLRSTLASRSCAEPRLKFPSKTSHGKKRSAEDAGIRDPSLQAKKIKSEENIRRSSEQGARKRPTSDTLDKKPTSISTLKREDSKPHAFGNKLVVKLKFGRSKAKTVAAILKLKPNSKTNFTSAIAATKSHAAHSNAGRNTVMTPQKEREVSLPLTEGKIARKTPSNHTTAVVTPHADRRAIDVEDSPSVRTEKRIRPADRDAPDSATKRLKLNDSDTKSRLTPSRSLKQEVSTPRKDSKVINGGTSNRVSTPKPANDTPKVVDHVDMSRKSTLEGPGTAKPNKSTHFWKTESIKLLDMGKMLKRQSEQTLKADKDGKKLSVLERVESILCFILAFSALQHTQGPHHSWIANWRSLLPMAVENVSSARDYRELNGVCALLSGVCHSHVTNIYAELKRCNVEVTEEPSKQLENLLQYLQTAQKHSVQAEQQLPRKVVSERYREMNRIYESMPVGLGVKPVMAVKLALAFMKEWAAQEKVPWKRTMEQNICSHFDA